MEQGSRCAHPPVSFSCPARRRRHSGVGVHTARPPPCNRPGSLLRRYSAPYLPYGFLAVTGRPALAPVKYTDIMWTVYMPFTPNCWGVVVASVGRQAGCPLRRGVLPGSLLRSASPSRTGAVLPQVAFSGLFHAFLDSLGKSKGDALGDDEDAESPGSEKGRGKHGGAGEGGAGKEAGEEAELKEEENEVMHTTMGRCGVSIFQSTVSCAPRPSPRLLPEGVLARPCSRRSRSWSPLLLPVAACRHTASSPTTRRPPQSVRHATFA